MHRSPVRELLKATERPEVISFAGGLPGADLLPLEAMEAASERVLGKHGQQAAQYGPTEGLPELREWIAERFSTEQVRLSGANVAMVSGGQQGLDLIGRIFLNPGDRVAVENPTYLALLSAWRPLGVEFLPVSCDRDGLRIDELHAALGRRPKLIYSIPDFQNPQGTTLALSRRRQLVRLAAEHGVGIVEDGAYTDLRYEGQSLPQLFELSREEGRAGETGSIFVGTFSKLLMPGLRVGWVVAPEVVIETLVRAKQSADLHTSSFTQWLTWELIQDDFLARHVPRLQAAYRERRDAMLLALERSMPPGVSWTVPEGGMFLMITLPEDTDVPELLRRALESKVAFVPGEDFHLGGMGRNTIRLNFSHATPALIREGVRRLGELGPLSRNGRPEATRLVRAAGRRLNPAA